MQGMEVTPRSEFERLIAQPEAQIDLAEAALWIAAESRPGTDIAASLAELETLAAGLEERIEAGASASGRFEALNEWIFFEQGFRGCDPQHYYEPEQSFLDVVLARREGIPILLSVVYLEVARRVGVDAEGVGFPGHFLVRVRAADALLVDPYARSVLSPADCSQRLRSLFGEAAQISPEMLEPASKRAILQRILGNLKRNYVAAGQLVEALACCDRILLLAPDAAPEWLERGVVHQHLGHLRAAAADFEHFALLDPADPRAARARAAAAAMRRQAPHLH